MNNIFNEMDHRLSVVKRWGILHTIQTQSVAEHAFNVARIAKRIAIDWWGITDKKALFILVDAALHHDDTEALSGDLPSMVKPYLDERQMGFDHSDLLPDWCKAVSEVDERAGYTTILKLADKLEGYHFLAIENLLGNRYISNHLDEETSIILNYVDTNCPEKHRVVDRFLTNMREEISVRHSRKGR